MIESGLRSLGTAGAREGCLVWERKDKKSSDQIRDF